MNGLPESPMSGVVPLASPSIGTEKRCSKCGMIKRMNEFSKTKSYKDGRMYWCKPCVSKYRKSTRGIDSVTQKRYRENNREKIRHLCKEWRKSHVERVRHLRNKWNRENMDKVLIAASRRYHSKERTNMDRLNNCMSCSIRQSIISGKNGRSWESIVGYSLEQLKKHIEKQFYEGMCWDNRGTWHIDHIIPKVAFNFETPDDIDFKRCWALSNLRPLWADINVRKSSNVDIPF